MLRVLRLALFAVLVQAAIASLPIPEQKSSKPFVIDADLKADAWYRLPKNSWPESYDIKLTTNIHKGEKEFTGYVEIVLRTGDLIATEINNNITLHYRNITIDKIELFKVTTPLVPEKLTENNVYDPVTEKFAIFTEQPLLPNTQYRLKITYNGVLRKDEAGFYESWYKAENGLTHWLATTQFESTDARHAFPCYDEPHLKATFTISITHGAKPYHAISNMQQNNYFESYARTILADIFFAHYLLFRL